MKTHKGFRFREQSILNTDIFFKLTIFVTGLVMQKTISLIAIA